MEFKIDKKDFLKGLEKTLSVVERRSTMPSLNHALLEIKDEQVQISATDLEIFVSSNVKCKTLTEGRVSIPARSVYDIVRECDDSADIHLKALENNKIEILSGKSNFKLLGLSADSFPHFKASPKGHLSTANLNCKDFARLIAKTDYAVSTEEIRYFLTGIFLESVEEDGHKVLRSVSTDGHRLSLFDLKQEDKNALEIKKGIIVPKKGCNELRKLLESTQEETFELSCDENLLRAKIGDYNLWIRPIDGEYPNYRPVVPSELKCQLKISRSAFIQSLKKMSLLVSDRSRVVTFDFKKNTVILSTNNPDLGEAYDEIPFEGKSPEIKTGFNVRFFMEALSHFDNDEVELHVGEKLQPALIKSKDEEGYIGVIMPMRT